MVITLRLITFLTTIGRFGFTESSALAPRAGSRPPISSAVSNTKVARNSKAIVANTGIAERRRLGLRWGRVGSVVVIFLFVSVVVVFVLVVILVLVVIVISIATRPAL